MTLSSALERSIRPHVQNYLEQGPNANRGSPISRIKLLTYIKERDRTLNRKKDVELTKAIDAVCKELEAQNLQQDDATKTIEIGDDDEEEVADRTMNQSITSAWKIPPATNGKLAQSEGAMKRKEPPISKGSRSKRPKVAEDREPPRDINLSNLGGVDASIAEIRDMIVMPFRHPEIYTQLGVPTPRGVLLHGPPGCGKTLLANAVAGELGVYFIQVSAPSLVSGMSGESEKKVRELFDEAKQFAPCLVFIDEIDAVTPKRENAQREMERRIVAQLLTCMDDMSLEKTDGKPVLIIGATNRPDSLDPALRRAGRFDREICMGVPDERSREQILAVLCQKLKISGDLDFKVLAKRTPGFVGADLNALTTQAGCVAIKRIQKSLQDAEDLIAATNEQDAQPISAENDIPMTDESTVNLSHTNGSDVTTTQDHDTAAKINQPLDTLSTHADRLSDDYLANLFITYADFLVALPTIQPSSKREGFTTVPDVTWQDIGALSSIREELQMAIVRPIKHPDIYKSVGITAPAGVLLWGPPGCGKTLLAKAVANESSANFISVRGPELLNKYVGESERAVRQVFVRARASAPCVIFFDELDALVPKRDNSLTESSARVVNTLLTELDGLGDRNGIFVIAATNRPDMIDPAMIRPGRLGKLLFVQLPTESEREEILKTLTKGQACYADSIDFNLIARDERCQNFSGADLDSLVRGAGVAALTAVFHNVSDEDIAALTVPPRVTQDNFLQAFDKVRPSVSNAERLKYDNLRKKLSQGVAHE